MNENQSLKPFESKTIAIIRYMGRQASNHSAFISLIANLKMDSSANNNSSGEGEGEGKREGKEKEEIIKSVLFTIPVEIEVTEQPGIYSPLKSIDFGTIFLTDHVTDSYSDEYSTWLFNKDQNVHRDLIYFTKKFNASVRTVDLYIVNNAHKPLTITEVYSVRHNSALDILVHENIEVPADTGVLTKVAEVRFDPTKSKRASQNYGKIIVKTNDTSIWLQISFNADLYKGYVF